VRNPPLPKAVLKAAILLYRLEDVANPWYPSPSASAKKKTSRLTVGLIPKQKPGKKPKPAPKPKIPAKASSVKVEDLFANSPLMRALLQERTAEEKAATAQSLAARTAMLKAYEGQQPILRDIHNRAIASQTKVEEALGRQVRGEAGRAGEGLTAALSTINAPAAAQQVQQLGTTWRGAETAGLAMGLTDVQRAMARGAASEEFMAKGPGIAESQAQQTLARRIGEIGAQYTKQKKEAIVHLTEKAEQRQREAEQARALKMRQLQQDKMAREELRAKERLALTALGDKIALKKFDAAQRQEDIKLRAFYQNEMRNIDREFQAQQSGIARDFQREQTLTQEELLRGRPAKPGAKKAKPDTVATPGGAKRGRAVSAVNAQLFNPKTGQLRDRYKYAEVPGNLNDRQATQYRRNKIVRAINSELSQQGVSPNSPLGIELRSATLRKAGYPVGRRGNPTGRPR
jgi:hypothetical protein